LTIDVVARPLRSWIEIRDVDLGLNFETVRSRKEKSFDPQPPPRTTRSRRRRERNAERNHQDHSSTNVARPRISGYAFANGTAEC
jgi:hypothetical protein